MFSVMAPPPSPSRPRRRSHSTLTLAATDEFWQVPALEDRPQTTSPSPSKIADGCGDADAVDDDDSVAATIDFDEAAAAEAEVDDDLDDDDCFEVIDLPPAHRQLLLPSAPVAVEDLKGRDHTAGMGRDCYRKGGRGDDKSSCPYDEESCADDDKLGCFARRGRGGSSFASRQVRGGSWLMGVTITSLDDSIAPEREDDVLAGGGGLLDFPAGLSLDSDECSSSSDGSSSGMDGSSRMSDSDPVDGPAVRRGVSFNASVTVHAIPHSSTLSAAQRRRMYSTTLEVRQNKARNKAEYRHDGCDWRRATEEWEMAVDMVTGELVHPAHDAARERCP